MSNETSGGPLRPNPIQTDVRARRRVAKFGPNPACVLCGEKRPEALTRVTRSWMELHHVVGEANDEDLIVPLCLSCHRKITEAYATAGVSMGTPETHLHRLLAVLRAFDVLFTNLGTSCGRWGEQLQQLIQWFDEQLPEWRKSAL